MAASAKSHPQCGLQICEERIFGSGLRGILPASGLLPKGCQSVHDASSGILSEPVAAEYPAQQTRANGEQETLRH
jgi:hypothetical protein